MHVPEVDEVVGEAHELEALVELDAGAAERSDGDAAGDRAVVADRARATASSVSSQKRARFSSEPPYASVRWL